MRIDTLVVGLVCLVIGFLGGYFFDSSSSKVTPQGQQVQDNSTPGQMDLQRKIADLEALLAREPDNRQAWVALGNQFFDAEQPMKAVDAYDRALALKGSDPNVLVDQGVMYRRLGWFDKAIGNFNKALEINPQHPQALYNRGIVYRYDLNDFKNAALSWRQLLEISPNAPGAAQLRKEVEFLESHPDGTPQPQ